MAKSSIDIAESLARLSATTIFELRGEWRRLHRAPPPMRLSRDLLMREVWRIDRLGRSTLHLLQILEQLRGRNVAFQSIMDGIDTNTAAGRMVFSMVGAIAEFERNVISERTKAGMAAARRRGLHVGRPLKLAPQQLVYARRMIVAGERRAHVARSLGVDPSTLWRLLMKGFTKA